jgi:hypothetical protein
MYRYFTLLLLLDCLSGAVYAQGQTPKLLLDAAHCLATEKQDWLGLAQSKPTELNLGYLVDTKSYHGEKVLYLVYYKGPKRSEGLVFAIFLRRQDGRRIFDVQNNARFRKSEKGVQGVDFVDPPLGGTWTQEHLVSAIKQIGRQATFVVPVKDLLAPSALTQCVCYADGK